MYYHFIDNGKGPTKIFIGGLHGSEFKTTIHFIKNISADDFSNGKIHLFNFDKSEYISTLNNDYYKSDIGLTILNIVKSLKPDFFIELHCYNIKNFDFLTSSSRFADIGVPPLIDLGDYILMGSVSPLIRTKYFSKDVVCQTYEIPCFNGINSFNGFNHEKSTIRLFELIDMIAKSSNRSEYEEKVFKKYPKQASLAIKYARQIFGKFFPPY